MAEAKPLTVRDALLLVLDQVDYTKGACSFTEMVGACLPAEVIDKARQALAAHGVAAALPHPDTARLDHLQRTGSTVELLPGFPGDPLQFRIGGLRTAVDADLRAAIDAAVAGVTASYRQVKRDQTPTKKDTP